MSLKRSWPQLSVTKTVSTMPPSKKAKTYRTVGTQTTAMRRVSHVQHAQPSRGVGPGVPRRIWQTYCLTVNSTAASPGFATYQFKANDPYRPDAANAISPLGWSLYGALFNYARVIGAQIEVEAVPTTAGFSSLVGLNWADAGTVMAIGTATASGYTFPAFYQTNSVPPKVAVGAQLPVKLRSPFLLTKDILKDSDENQDAVTAAGGGAASPGSLWYFNVQTQPLVAAANVTVMKIKLRQLVEFYDCTVA